MSTQTLQIKEIATSFEVAYRSTPLKLKLLDAFSVCALLTALLQVCAVPWEAAPRLQARPAPPPLAAARRRTLLAAVDVRFAPPLPPRSLCTPSWWAPSPSTPSWPASSAASAPLW